MNTTRLLSLAAAVCFGAALASAQVTIGTYDTPTGYGSLRKDSAVEGWAQTFRAPDATYSQLNEFQLYFQKPGTAMEFTVSIASWNGGATPAPDAPFWSRDFNTSIISGAVDAHTFVIGGGGLKLDASATYAILVTTSSTTTSPDMGIGLVQPAYYSAGDTFMFNGTSWSDGLYAGTGFDFAFAAAFSTVGGTSVLGPISPISAAPEPAVPGLALALAGVAGYAAWQRRRVASKR